MQFADVAFFLKIPNYLLPLRAARELVFLVVVDLAAGAAAPFAGVAAALLALYPPLAILWFTVLEVCLELL
jgi:hypothetical protein